MYAAACLSDPAQMQRAVGELRVAVKRFGIETVLDELRQAGCLKARFPRRTVAGWMDMVMLNTGGGIAGGDRLDVAIKVGSGARATVVAQAAERFYRTLQTDQPSRVRTRLTIEPGAAMEWLPQEAILFDGSALDRRLEVTMAADASFLGVETVVLGRTAMGELVRQGWLRDLIQVQRGGELLLHDAVRMEGDMDARMRHAAVGQGAKVFATLVYVAPDAPDRLAAVRDAFGAAEAAASVWNGMLVARVLAADSAAARKTVVAALNMLRGCRPLPRLWVC